MTHFILFLYLLSGFSGVSSIIYLIGKYGKNTPYMKGYMRIHLIYTTMMLVSLVILYLRVNVITSPILMQLLIASVLAGQGFLLYALSHFSFTINSRGIGRKTKVFWRFVPALYFILALLQFLIWDTPYTLLPIIIAVPLFLSLSIWFSLRNHKADLEENRKNNRIWFAFLAFTLVIIATELWLKQNRNFLGEYSLNMPVIFLVWNGINLYQFGIEEKMRKKEPIQQRISDETARRWQLTEREKEIAEAVMKGNSNKEIASDLHISSSTVKNHIYNIYRKTGVQGRVELVNLLK